MAGQADIEVLWIDPPGVTEIDTYRNPGWQPNMGPNSLPGGEDDVAVVSGQLYTYQVCLKYASGQACGTTTGALPPNCAMTFSCVEPVYAPPLYNLQCASGAEFYLTLPDGTQSLLNRGPSVSGTSSLYNEIVSACVPGAQMTQGCTGFSIAKLQSAWCAPPPPPPPPRPPSSCLKEGCVPVAGGRCLCQ